MQKILFAKFAKFWSKGHFAANGASKTTEKIYFSLLFAEDGQFKLTSTSGYNQGGIISFALSL